MTTRKYIVRPCLFWKGRGRLTKLSLEHNSSLELVCGCLAFSSAPVQLCLCRAGLSCLFSKAICLRHLFLIFSSKFSNSSKSKTELKTLKFSHLCFTCNERIHFYNCISWGKAYLLVEFVSDLQVGGSSGSHVHLSSLVKHHVRRQLSLSSLRAWGPRHSSMWLTHDFDPLAYKYHI